MTNNPLIKMQQNIFSLRRKYFHTSISSSLSNLYTETSYTDVTLVSDDQIQFQAPKFILSACCPVMKNLLLSNVHSHPLIYLRGIKQQELGSILQFMYHGEAAIHQNSMPIFLENAKALKIKQMADCFVTGNTLVIEDVHANSEEDAEYEDMSNLDILANHEDVSKYRTNTKSISSTVNEIPYLDLGAYSPDMDESDSCYPFKCGECDGRI